MSTRALGKSFKVKTGADGKTKMVRVKVFRSVSDRLASKKKKRFKPAGKS